MIPDFISTVMDKDAIEILPEIIMFLSLAGLCVVVILIEKRRKSK